MNSLSTKEKSKPSARASSTTEPVSTPKLDQIVKAICFDARQDALKYALRSDTGHDGE